MGTVEDPYFTMRGKLEPGIPITVYNVAIEYWWVHLSSHGSFRRAEALAVPCVDVPTRGCLLLMPSPTPSHLVQTTHCVGSRLLVVSQSP